MGRHRKLPLEQRIRAAKPQYRFADSQHHGDGAGRVRRARRHRDPALPLLLPVLAALGRGQAPAGPPRRQPGIPSALPLSAKHGFRPAARAQLGPDRRNGPRRREAEKNSVHRKFPPRLPADAGEGAPGNGTPAASHLLLRQIHRAGLRLAPEFHFRRRRHRLRRRGRG